MNGIPTILGSSSVTKPRQSEKVYPKFATSIVARVQSHNQPNHLRKLVPFVSGPSSEPLSARFFILELEQLAQLPSLATQSQANVPRRVEFLPPPAKAEGIALVAQDKNETSFRLGYCCPKSDVAS